MFTPAIFTRNHDFWRDPFEDSITEILRNLLPDSRRM